MTTAGMLIPTNYEQLRTTKVGRLGRSWKRQLVSTMLMLSDVLVAIFISLVAAILQGIWGNGTLSNVAVATMATTIAVWVGLRGLMGLYKGYGMDSVEELRLHTYTVFATLAMLAVFAIGFQVGDLLSRLMLVLVFLGLLLFTPLTRHLTKTGVKRLGIWGKPVMVLSYKESGANIVSSLKGTWELGYDPVAVFDYRLDMTTGSFEADHQKTLANVVEVAREWDVDTAIFAMPHIRREQLAKLVDAASISFRHVLIIPNLSGVTNSAVVARDLAGTFAVEIKYNLLDPWSRRVKRALDVFGAVVGGLLISPILVVIVILIKLDSHGSAFFVQERPGLKGRMFKVFKFRTMHTEAEQRFEELCTEGSVFVREFEKHGKLKDDPRVTRVGKWLRKFSLDELPQLWNVLKGEMSLIGPRPYLVSQVSQMNGHAEIISRIMPGMSGLWQVSGRSETTFEQRLDLDIYYVRDWSIWLDLVLLARTVKTVVLSRGAY